MVGILTYYLLDQRLKQTLPFVQGDVLDLGCGDAPILHALPQIKGYVGVDMRRETVERQRKLYPQHEFVQYDLDTQPLDLSRRFDTILMLAVLEHLAQPDYLISQIPGLLKPGGRLLLTTPTPSGNQVHHVGAQIRLFSQEAADEHKFIYNQYTLNDLMEHNGLRIVKYKRFLLGQNQLCVAEASSRI